MMVDEPLILLLLWRQSYHTYGLDSDGQELFILIGFGAGRLETYMLDGKKSIYPVYDFPSAGIDTSRGLYLQTDLGKISLLTPQKQILSSFSTPQESGETYLWYQSR